MRPILERLAAGEIILSDGAMGTMLMQRGWQPGDAPERINLEQPDILVDIHREYRDAGAEILLANTFGGHPLKLAQYDLADQTEAVNRNAVEAVRSVARDDVYVGASVGPCGDLLKPYGDAEPDDLMAGYLRQFEIIVSIGVDIICVETMTDLAEASLAVRAAKSVAPGVPVCGAMTFDETPGGFRTIMGTSIEEAASGLTAAGVDLLGSNCGYGIESLTAMAVELRRHTSLPIQIRPNAGLPELHADGPVYPETPQFMAERCGALIEAGVNIMGGCCGTTPAHIRALRDAVIGYSAARR